MGERPYQMCTKTVMDTTDPNITFDENGVCNYVHYFNDKIQPLLEASPEKESALRNLIDDIATSGKGKEYDCIVGLSGGVDSSYLVYYLKKIARLRPLAVHLDTGWNSELAVKNIENIVKILDVDLFTFVVDWEEMKDLQIAFLKSAVANQDIPQDHAIIATLYKIAKQKKIKYIISGHNMATESILPSAWGYDAMDTVHIKAIHKRFGKLGRLRYYPLLNFYDYYLYSRYILRIQSVRFLNLINYNKAEAMEILQDKFGWRYYGGKHYESRFTKFFQSYYLPIKFGFDKRKAHLSSLIVSNQITREVALKELAKPLYDETELLDDKDFVRKKLGLSDKEFESILSLPPKSYKDYPSNESIYKTVRTAYFQLKRLRAWISQDPKPEYVIRF